MRCPAGALLIVLGMVSAGGVRAQDAIQERDDSSIALQLKRGDPHSVVGIWFHYDQKLTSFDFIQYGGYEHPKFLLLKKIVHRETQTFGDEFDDVVDRFDVTAYEVEGPAKGAALYALHVVPDSHDQFSDLAEVAEDEGFLRVYTGAQDGEDPEAHKPAGPYRYYDIRTGQLLVLADGHDSVEKVFVKDEAKPARFIGVATRHLPYLASELDPNHEYVATVTYGSSRGIMRKARIEATEAALKAARLPLNAIEARVRIVPPNNQGKGPLSWLPRGPTAGETFDKVSVWVELTGGVGVEIPLVKDRLDIDNAILPAGFSISRED